MISPSLSLRGFCFLQPGYVTHILTLFLFRFPQLALPLILPLLIHLLQLIESTKVSSRDTPRAIKPQGKIFKMLQNLCIYMIFLPILPRNGGEDQYIGMI